MKLFTFDYSIRYDLVNVKNRNTNDLMNLIILVLLALILQGCPQQMVKHFEEQDRRIEELKNRKPVYLTQDRNIQKPEELIKMYFADTLANYDSLITNNSFPLRFEINKIESDSFPKVITIRASVFDTNGRYISGLAPPYYTGSGTYKDFWSFLSDSCQNEKNILSNFDVEEIRNNKNVPYAMTFILDHSGSMGNKRILKLREAVKHVLYATKPGDMVGIIKFAAKPLFEVPLTNNPKLFRKNFVVENAETKDIGSGTAIYSSIDLAISQFDTIDNNYKKVIILFSDGEDNQSKIKIDSILKLSRQKQVEIYTIAFGYTDKNMEKLANYSGGKFYPIISTREFPYVFKDIYTTLNNYYKITYKPTECYGEHFVDIKLRLPFLKDVSISAFGNYDKSVFTSLDPVGTVYLVNIEFDFGKSEVSAESEKDIELIAESMKKNPEMKIAVNGHTDDKGSDDYNMKLSLDRAKSVVQKLIDYGINKDRLSAVGYGKSRPIAPNDSDENRKRNRRTEFEIISK